MRKWGLEPPPLQSRKGIDIRARRAAGDKAFAAVLAGMPVPEAALKFDVEESSIYRRRRDHEKRKALETAKAPPPPAARETSIVPHKPPPPPASVEVMQGRGGRTKAELVQQLLRFTLESDEREPSELERELAETRKERDAAKLALEMVLEKVTGQLR